ncbi:MAG: GNAT family N-acetyltransferase, partial [Spirochaetaceae bacterium]|nr:GNAT family N-acetyltransferase [Spirochaetaceae bacterium]
DDFMAVRDFLVESFANFDPPANWLVDRWNFVGCMARHFHGLSVQAWSAGIGLWMDESGATLGMANEEEGTGAVFVQVRDPGVLDRALAAAMLDFAEVHCVRERGEKGLGFELRLPPALPALAQEAAAREYRPAAWSEPLSSMAIAGGGRAGDALEPPALPAGYRFSSGAELDPAEKAVAHQRAFGYGNEPVFAAASFRAFSDFREAPDYRGDLDLSVRGPKGDLVAFACAWLDSRNRLVVLEPVGTVPEERRKGLGEAVCKEALRRAAALGARTGWVGSDQEFYRAMGFTVATRQAVVEYRPSKGVV